MRRARAGGSGWRGYIAGPWLRGQESAAECKTGIALRIDLPRRMAMVTAMVLWMVLSTPFAASAGPKADPTTTRQASPETRRHMPPAKNPAKDKQPTPRQPSKTVAPVPTSPPSAPVTHPPKRGPRQAKPSPPTSVRGTFIEPLKAAPFPLAPKNADSTFFDFTDPKSGERFRTTRNFERLAEKDHYRDSSVLFHLPPHFTPTKPFSYVVFFHGNRTDVQQAVKEYDLDDQVNHSERNVVLVLPQLAKNAADSSPGKFASRNAFQVFMTEVARVLTRKLGKKYEKQLTQAPIILAAFSGGYKPLACTLDRGGVDARIKGILLLDGLYEDLYIFAKWVLGHASTGYFINIFTEGSICQERSLALASFLREHRLPFREGWPKAVKRGEIALIRSPYDHLQVPVEGPPREPLAALLRRLKE